MIRLKLILTLFLSLIMSWSIQGQSITGMVSHCSAGQVDGAINLTVNTGTQNLTYYKWAKLVSGVPQLIEQGSSINDIDVNNLQDGLYLFYYQNGSNLVDYRYFLVGEEGKTTSVNFKLNNNNDRKKYNEDALIKYLKSNQDGSNTGGGQTGLTAATNSSYDSKALIKYKVDFDSSLEFLSAEQTLDPKGGHYRKNATDNSGWLSLITSNWEENTVTWNSAPNTMTTDQVSIAPTQANTYTMRFDTLDILKFVEYWQNNTNNGFELALQNYNQQSTALLDYESSDYGSPNLILSYTVIPPVQTSFNDETNMGTITVNAPQGNLPYTYLINTAPIGTLQDAWNNIGDTSIIDSATFFNGQVSVTEFTFSNLPSGHYYAAVFDNAGVKLLDGDAIVNTEIGMVNPTGLVQSSDNIFSLQANAQNAGFGRLFGELLPGDAKGGGVEFELVSIGNGTIGFNKTSDNEATQDSDFEFGFKMLSNGTCQVIDNHVLQQTTINITVNSKIKILREFDDFVLYINDVENYRAAAGTYLTDALSMDMLLLDGLVKIKTLLYIHSYKIHSFSTSIAYPECGSDKGGFTFTPSTFITVNSIDLTNNYTASTYFGAIDPGTGIVIYTNLPIGTYTLRVTYTTPGLFGPPVSYLVYRQIAIGYVVEWEEMVNNFVSPLNTIQPVDGIVFPSSATANSTNITYSGELNWVQFQTNVWSGGLGASNSESIAFRNLLGENAFNFSVSNSLTWNVSAFLSNVPPSGMGMGSIMTIPPNDVWRIEQDGLNYKLFNNGTSLITSGNSATPEKFELSIKQVGKPQFIEIIASFCPASPDQYIEPKREMEGGYFIVPSDDILRFEFKEEYVFDTNLDFVVRDFKGQPQVGLGTLVEIFDDNRLKLDVSSLAIGVYIMEIKNDKGENWFLRFKVE